MRGAIHLVHGEGWAGENSCATGATVLVGGVCGRPATFIASSAHGPSGCGYSLGEQSVLLEEDDIGAIRVGGPGLDLFATSPPPTYVRCGVQELTRLLSPMEGVAAPVTWAMWRLRSWVTSLPDALTRQQAGQGATVRVDAPRQLAKRAKCPRAGWTPACPSSKAAREPGAAPARSPW
eukprot:5508099-Amphidinium_carterae.1